MVVKKILFSFISLSIGIYTFGQSAYNSIYTKYGFGQINNLQSTFQLGQGGLSLTDAYYNQVNLSNPASYSYLAPHIPVFDVAIGSEFIQATSLTSSRLFKTTEASNFTLGLPTSKKSGIAFSYQPFSKMGYNITDSLTFQDTISQLNLYKGNGSINRFVFGFSHKLYTADSTNFSLSLGANASYLFGSLSNVRQQQFASNSGYLSLLEKDSTNVKDVVFDIGLYANYGKGKSLFTLGLVYNPTSKLTIKDEYVAYLYYGSLVNVVDTLATLGVQKGNMVLPGSISGALSYSYNYKWGIGVQFSQRNMSDFSKTVSNEVKDKNLSLSSEVNTGLWFKPSAVQYLTQGGALKNATYKVGFRYKTLGVNINNTEITEMAISTGLNLPLVASGSFSSINFGIEFGQRGTVDHNLVQEKFVRGKIGIAITPSRSDRWFVKRKYN